jgi:crotonobetainyl-CoA:carnitine CoA-transferase CaiB-like acyl-CoA transferase
MNTTSEQSLPLRGIKVIETASVLAGPAVGMFFAELGAHVIKLENAKAGGDVTRKWKLPNEDPKSSISAYFSSVNYGKEHRYVDLGSAEGRVMLDELVAQTDVIITNHLAGDAEKLGLQRERLRSLNPTIIHGHVRGYAEDPSRPAYDVVLQAEIGYIGMTGTNADQLAKLPVAMIDILAAHQLKEGLLLALLQRERTGKGAYVEVSLEEAAFTGLINQASNWLMAKQVAKPIGTLHPNIAPYGELFTCADGNRLVLAVGSNEQFKALCGVLDLSDLVHDQHFSSNAKRVSNRNVLAQLLAPAIGGSDREMLLDKFANAQVPAGAVNTLDQALSSPIAERMTIAEMIDGVRTLRISGNAFRIETY